MENAARMQAPRYGWAAGLLATLLVVIIPIVLFVPGSKPPADQPWAAVPVRKQHVDHRDLLKGPYESGSEVTRACLECHPNSSTAGDEHRALDLGEQALPDPRS
jgi:hypothetical protein